MGLFTNPVVLNNGADHTFVFRNSTGTPQSSVGEWIEPAAAAAAESRIFSKYNTADPNLVRSVTQRSVKAAIPDGTMKRITVNISVVHHPEHTEAQVNAELALVKDILAEATYASNMFNRLP